MVMTRIDVACMRGYHGLQTVLKSRLPSVGRDEQSFLDVVTQELGVLVKDRQDFGRWK